MKVKETIIKEIDLKKLMEAKGIKSVYELAKLTGVKSSGIYPALNGKITLGSYTWNKLKKVLNTESRGSK